MALPAERRREGLHLERLARAISHVAGTTEKRYRTIIQIVPAHRGRSGSGSVQ